MYRDGNYYYRRTFANYYQNVFKPKYTLRAFKSITNIREVACRHLGNLV